jgi:hypothetical protein
LAPENLTTLAHFSVSSCDELAEIGGRHQKRRATPIGKPRLHRGKLDRTPDRHLKISRAVAIRYDQLAEPFPGMLNLAAARYWIKSVYTALCGQTRAPLLAVI